MKRVGVLGFYDELTATHELAPTVRSVPGRVQAVVDALEPEGANVLLADEPGKFENPSR